MSKPLYTYQPNLVTSLLPNFFRNLTASILLAGLIVMIVYGLNLVGITSLPLLLISFWLGIGAILLALLPLFLDILIFKNTTYNVYETHITYEYDFITQKKYTAQHNQIVNIRMNVNVWDRLTGCGDIIIHTADDTENDLRLKHVKNPETVQKTIQDAVNSSFDQAS